MLKASFVAPDLVSGVFLYSHVVQLLNRDYITAILLSRLIFWYTPDKNKKSRLRVSRGGYWWVVKSHKEWEQECGLSRSQVNRALSKLRNRKIIVTEVHKFRKAPTCFIRLSDTSLIAHPCAIIECTPACNHGLHTSVQSCTSTNFTEETFHLSAPKDFSMKMQGGKEDKESTKVLKSFMENQNQKKLIPPEAIKKTPTALSHAWKIWVTDKYSLPMHKNFTKIQIGQFSQLVKALGVLAGPVSRWAVYNWTMFIELVKKDTGVKLKTGMPQVGILLSHCMTAAKGYNDTMTLIAKTAPKVTVVESAKEETPDATLEEMKDIFEKYGLS
jgi:hypothetical protein